MRGLRILLLAGVWLWALRIAMPAAPASATQSDTQLRAKLQADLNRYLASRAQAEHISAISLSISLAGRADNLNLTSGRTTWGGKTPVRPSNLFDIGSNTKAFTACLLLQLEAEGKLSIDQTVGHWLPQYPAWSRVSIRTLLNMTSGIMGYDNVPAMARAQATTIHRRWTDAQLVAFVDPVYGKAPPPTHGYNYSNTNYILAGMIVERATGHTYADELRRRFIDGLGLHDTFYSPNIYSVAVLNRMVSGYFFNNAPNEAALKPLLGKDMRTMDRSWAAAAGGMIATPEDVTRWARALYAGRVLPAHQQRELMTLVNTKSGQELAQTSSAAPGGFGLGVVQSYRKPFGRFWFYQGETLGYRMIHVWLPKSNVVLALGLNSQPPASQEDHIGILLGQIYDDLRASGVIRPNI